MRPRHAPLALVCCLPLVLSSGPSKASDTQFVVADVARVRARPHERGAVVGLLRINARVNPSDEPTRNTWAKVSVPDSALEGWVAWSSIRPTKVTLEEARAETAGALTSGNKANALTWADRLRALSPAEVKDLTLARTVYERFQDTERLQTVLETLSGQQKLYFATCAEGALIVVARFDSINGLQKVREPSELARWIAGAPWYAVTESTREAQRVEGGLFASPRDVTSREPAPDKNDPEENVEGSITHAERVVLDAHCGPMEQTGPLVTWPYRRVEARAPGAAARTPDAGAPDSGEPGDDEPESHFKTMSVRRRDALELNLKNGVHHFEFEQFHRSVPGCEETNGIHITQEANGQHSTLDVILTQQISC